MKQSMPSGDPLLSVKAVRPLQVKRIRDALDGVILLDKPVGLSSNDALIQAKRLLNAKKAGHTGTLDPFATGLLPLCFGEATKFSQDLLEADKTYEAVVHLGVSTDTGDTEGRVVEPVNAEAAQAALADVDLARIHTALAQFRGPIAQVPPMYSALKRDGKPLYEYARAGITLERQARNIVIHALTLLDYSPPFLRLRVACSKGTYIRVLGEDIGRALGCGAHLNALRRIQVGDLVLAGAVTLDQVAQLPQAERVALLLPVDSLLQSFPEVRLSDVLSDRFLHGQRLALQKELGVTESVDSVALAVEKNAENAAEKDVENSKNEVNAENAVTAVTALTISRLPDAVGRVRVYRHSNGQLLGSGQLQEYQVLAPERLISTSF